MSLSDFLFKPFETPIKPLEFEIKPMPDEGPLRLVWHFAIMFKGVLAIVFTLSTITALISLATIWAVAFIVDGINSSTPTIFLFDNAALLIGFFILIAAIDPLISFVRGAFMAQTVQTLMPAAMRWQAHRAVEAQDIAFFEDIFAGQVASRIAQVVGSVQTQMMIAMRTIPRVTIQFFGAFALLLILAWPLAVPVFFWIIANIILAKVMVPHYLARSKKVAAATSRATGAMTDVYSNIAMVKLFAAERSEAGAIHKVIGETIQTQHSENRSYIASNSIVQIFNALLMVSIFIIGIWGIHDGFVTVGEFVASVSVAQSLAVGSNAFIALGQSITRTLGTISDAMPVMTSLPTITDKDNAKPLSVKGGGIQFRNISFSYAQAAEPVFENLELSIKPGEKVGIIGLSGAGKSTLVSLLLRLRDVDHGAILIDGQDIRDVQQASLREKIGVVTQDTSLLNRSIRDNIRYGNPDATDDEIRTAARSAEALEFIDGLTDVEGRRDLDAFVGDKGVKLSGGQRQRIAIARMLLKDAPILVLDEATSALDSEAEAAIQSNLDMLMHGKTSIAIAHRLSTIQAMDRLIVLDGGKISESGSHAELVNSNGLYASLWARQSGGFIGRDITR